MRSSVPVNRIRSRLTYANVMSTIGVFLLIGTGAAFAAKQVLPKKSVGTKQLKSNAVTAAKIKKNAVTRVKIKKDAVDGSKIADGSVTGTEINAASTPFSRIVHEARGSGTVSVPTPGPVVYPLSNPTYTQEPERDDTFAGAVDVRFEPSCTPPRDAVAYLIVDPLAPNEKPDETNISAAGVFRDQTGATPSGRVNLGAYLNGVRFQQSTPSSHTLELIVVGSCDTGSGVVATSGAVDVIGTK